MMVCRKEKEESVKASVICDRGFFVCVSSWKGMEGEIQMAKSVEIRWHGRGGQGAKTAALLLADEPTSALDVTVQKQILEEIYQLSRKENLGVLFITHDLGVVAEIADDVSIMKDGEIVENGTVEEIFYHPQHSYTKKLLDAVL